MVAEFSYVFIQRYILIPLAKIEACVDQHRNQIQIVCYLAIHGSHALLGSAFNSFPATPSLVKAYYSSFLTVQSQCIQFPILFMPFVFYLKISSQFGFMLLAFLFSSLQLQKVSRKQQQSSTLLFVVFDLVHLPGHRYLYMWQRRWHLFGNLLSLCHHQILMHELPCDGQDMNQGARPTGRTLSSGVWPPACRNQQSTNGAWVSASTSEKEDS